MTRSPDVLFMAEYIKNVLYFATVRQGKSLKSTADTHYFSIDNELLYENYYSDFGPLNLGCVYKYCKILNDKLKQYLNKQTIVHYTTIDPKKKANAAFLLGCYGVLYLSLTPRDALKPLTVHGQSYRPFQDATQGESIFTINLLDCLQAIKKASELGFFNFQDFNYEEYERLDKIQGGDLNWIIPGKFLAFIGPVDYSVSLYHPPEMYLDYFMENNVKIVVRLNKRLYEGTVFSNVGIAHYDLFFPDGSTPPRHILFKFMQISEDSDCAIAVHCKAGLGRTGSLIGCYLIKHYRMTSHEAIGWMRICRPGSVIGHQQEWLEKLEAWLLKQGNIYRKRLFQDCDKLPYHEYGVYSIAEKAIKQGPTIFHKCPSPPPPIQRQTRPEIRILERPQASRGNIDGFHKTTERESNEWRMRTFKVASKPSSKGDQFEMNNESKRISGAGEPRALRPHTRVTTARSQRNNVKPNDSRSNIIRSPNPSPISTFCTTQGHVKTINDAKNFLMRSSAYSEERSKKLNSSVMITPHRLQNYHEKDVGPPPNSAHITPSAYSAVNRTATQPQYRRRLGRSPSPSPVRNEQTRATNTPVSSERIVVREASRSTLQETLSRLKLTTWRDGSVGAASLGARRDAPNPKRAPSVRSDERPIATQGDMLNSIKFQRRFRESLHTNTSLQDKQSPKEKSSTTSRNLRPTSPKGRRGQSPSY